MKILLGQITQNNRRTSSSEDEAAPGILDEELESDFEKDGVPASWAPGYPKSWGSELWKFSTRTDPTNIFSSASATADEKFLAIATGEVICIFSLWEDEEMFKLESVLKSEYGMVVKIEFAKSPVGGETGYILAAHYSRDPVQIDSHVQIWRLDEGCKPKPKGNLQGEERFTVEGKFATFSPSVFSHDSKTLLYISDVRDDYGKHPRTTALDVATGKERFVLDGHMDAIMWVGFSPDDKLIATTAWDGSLKLYNSETGEHIRDYGPTGGQNWTCGFSPDSKDIAVSRGSGAGGVATFLWRTDESRSFPVSLLGAKGWQRLISWSPDGQKLAIGAADGRLVVYDTQAMTLSQVWQVGEMEQRWFREVAEVKWLEGGKRVLWKPSDGSVRVYDFEENRKWKWGPGEKDEWRLGAWFNTCVVLEGRGLFGTVDQDGVFRVWNLPGA